MPLYVNINHSNDRPWTFINRLSFQWHNDALFASTIIFFIFKCLNIEPTTNHWLNQCCVIILREKWWVIWIKPIMYSTFYILRSIKCRCLLCGFVHDYDIMVRHWIFRCFSPCFQLYMNTYVFVRFARVFLNKRFGMMPTCNIISYNIYGFNF